MVKKDREGEREEVGRWQAHSVSRRVEVRMVDR